MEFRVGVGEWNCRFFVSKFLAQRRRDAEYAEFFRAAFGRGGLEDTSSSLKTISTSVGSGQKIFSHKDHKVHIALCDSLCSMWLIKIAGSVGFF